MRAMIMVAAAAAMLAGCEGGDVTTAPADSALTNESVPAGAGELAPVEANGMETNAAALDPMAGNVTEQGNTDHGNTDHGNTDHGNTDH